VLPGFAGSEEKGVKRRNSGWTDGSQACPQIEAVIEIPKWSFLKRGSSGRVDFVSPFPCPFNYGSVPEYVGLEGDLLDVLVLGPRLARGTRVEVRAIGAVGLSDRGMYDDKIVGSREPLRRWQPAAVLLFFRFYAVCKRLLNVYRGRPGLTRCEGWGNAAEAIQRATRRDATWRGPEVSF
jgi:inorganic pyrophosphatase